MRFLRFFTLFRKIYLLKQLIRKRGGKISKRGTQGCERPTKCSLDKTKKRGTGAFPVPRKRVQSGLVLCIQGKLVEGVLLDAQLG